jgi:hypothetical protein
MRWPTFWCDSWISRYSEQEALVTPNIAEHFVLSIDITHREYTREDRRPGRENPDTIYPGRPLTFRKLTGKLSHTSSKWSHANWRYDSQNGMTIVHDGFTRLCKNQKHRNCHFSDEKVIKIHIFITHFHKFICRFVIVIRNVLLEFFNS